MAFDAPATTRMPFHPRRRAVTLTFVLQKLIETSVRAVEYSLSVLSKLFKPFMRYRGNNICPDE